MDRQAIVDALSTVTDVQGLLFRPATPNVGDAWPFLAGFERDEESGQFFVNTRVYVFLPQDGPASETWVEDHWADLVDALRPHAYVVSLEPVSVPVSPTASALCLEISMRSE